MKYKLFIFFFLCFLSYNDIANGKEYYIKRNQLKYFSIFNNPLKDSMIGHVAIDEFKRGLSEFHLKYNILTGLGGAGKWKIDITENELEALFKSDGQIITEINNINQETKKQIINYIKKLEENDPAIKFFVSVISTIQDISFSALSILVGSYDYIESYKEYKADQLLVLIANGGKIIKTACVITSGKKILINQKVLYTVSVGYDSITIPIREASVELKCSDSYGKTLDCIESFIFPMIQLYNNEPSKSINWECKNFDISKVSYFKILIFDIFRNETKSETTDVTEIKLNYSYPNYGTLDIDLISVSAYDSNGKIIAKSNTISLENCFLEIPLMKIINLKIKSDSRSN